MKHLLLIASVSFSIQAFSASLIPVPSYMTIEEATGAHADFPLVGEYVSTDGKTAIQANMLPDGTFLVAEYQGGLPGDGWDRSAIKSSVKTSAELKTAIKAFQKVARESPTMGKAAPEDVLLKFPEDFTNVKDGYLMAGGKTKKNVGSFRMHMEFLIPFKPARPLGNQDRANSGIYIFNNYEIQVMDSFALDFNHPENNAIELPSKNTQWCGCLYTMKLPDVNMCYPPLRWQTYDLEFTAPVFNGDKKVKNARITVRHNGVLIHDDVELPTGTGAGAKRKQLASGPVFFQDHATPVMFRNVWATEPASDE